MSTVDAAGQTVTAGVSERTGAVRPGVAGPAAPRGLVESGARNSRGRHTVPGWGRPPAFFEAASATGGATSNEAATIAATSMGE
ncbi:hypothetical protein Lfu02_04710 [Longispora fulva]|nr:hypothetical protein Lfu02_04710 [Longispora fulva]